MSELSAGSVEVGECNKRVLTFGNRQSNWNAKDSECMGDYCVFCIFVR